MKKNIKLLILIMVICMLLSSIALAASRKVDIVEKLDGKQYLQFQVEATASDADYTYRTKGWHINANFGDKTFSGFFTDSQLEGNTTDTTVTLPLGDILEAIGVTDEYLKQGGTLELNAGQIIVVNGAETTPIYDSYNGIVNGIVDRYGVEWSSTAKNDLKSYYDLSIDFEPVAEIPPPIPVLSKEDGTVIPNDSTIYVYKGETLRLNGKKSWFPPEAKFRYFLWEYKKESSSTWINVLEGENEDTVELYFDETGTYNLRMYITDEFEQVK